MDRKDLDLTKSTYWPESTEDHGMYVGLSHEFCDWAYSLRQGSSHKASHYVTNILIDLNGNQAKRETAFIYRTVPTDGGPTDLLFGRYRDLCERAKGGSGRCLQGRASGTGGRKDSLQKPTQQSCSESRPHPTSATDIPMTRSTPLTGGHSTPQSKP